MKYTNRIIFTFDNKKNGEPYILRVYRIIRFLITCKLHFCRDFSPKTSM